MPLVQLSGAVEEKMGSSATLFLDGSSALSLLTALSSCRASTHCMDDHRLREPSKPGRQNPNLTFAHGPGLTVRVLIGVRVRVRLGIDVPDFDMEPIDLPQADMKTAMAMVA